MSNEKTNSKNKTNRHSLVNFPEVIDEKNHIKVYGETSYENQIAVLSHYLHNTSEKLSKKRKEEIVGAIREFLERKQSRQKLSIEELTDEEIWAAAESPTQYNLFEEFFKVPFPGPKEPRFTFIDLFAGIGGFRIAMQNLGGKCVYSSEFDVKAQESYLANYGEMPFGDITKPTTKQYIPKKFDVLCAGFHVKLFQTVKSFR